MTKVITKTAAGKASRNVRRRETCRLCGGKRLELVLALAPTPVADAYLPEARWAAHQEKFPLDLFLCLDCAHAHLLDVVDPEILYRDYIYVTLSSLGLEAHFQKYADDVLARVKPLKGGLVVEFGSNDGTLLRGFAKRGMKVLGVDPAREIARQATASGIETLPEYFTAALARKIRAEKGAASIIVANNVMANIDVLDDVMEGIKSLLSPEGVFIFETGYLLDTVKNSVFDNIYHEHISYHSVRPFQAFFKRHGMELQFVERVETKGGSLRGTVQLAGGSRPVSPTVAEFIAREDAAGLHKPETYKAWGARLQKTKKELHALLGRLKKEGKTIAGYGASHSVTTLLHHFDIAQYLSFLVDDNPRKFDTFSPGHHIPVFASKALYERKPDYVVILPWRFGDPIIKKNQAFQDQGGRFISVLPKVEIL
jgi:SAM-dependent methyltransferase